MPLDTVSPDAVPRQIPDEWLNFENPELFSEGSAVKRFNRLTYKKFKNSLPAVGISLVFLALFGTLIYLSICSLLGIHVSGSKVTPLMAVFLLLFSAFMIGVGIYAFLHDSTQNRNPKRTNLYHKLEDSPDTKAHFNLLLTQGSKAIATVLDISYQPMSNAYNETYSVNLPKYYAGKPHHTLNTTYTLNYYHAYPLFRLLYTFNPPDDDNPSDLLHEIYLPCYPGDSLKPGDPLPILYYIDPENSMNVSSVPYPYPLKDAVLFQHMMYYPKS